MNAIRLKQNKVSLPLKPEVSVTYLLQAYRHLDEIRNNVFIVPVILTYDRIFELSQIAEESLKAQRINIPIKTILSNIVRVLPEKMGDIYVKFCKPINITEQLQAKGVKELNAAAVPKIATQLTRSLYRIEAVSQPLTMNSVVAAIILYQNSKTIKVEEILEDADFIFQYLMRKRA